MSCLNIKVLHVVDREKGGGGEKPNLRHHTHTKFNQLSSKVKRTPTNNDKEIKCLQAETTNKIDFFWRTQIEFWLRVSWSVTGDQLNSNYLTTQIHFLIGGERVTCPGSKRTYFKGKARLANSLGKQQLELSTREWSGRAPWNRGKFVCQPTSRKYFFRVRLLSGEAEQNT